MARLLSACCVFVLVDAFHIVAGSKQLNGDSVSLTPSPEALVEEGKSLNLQCDTGLHIPEYVNWYLNNDGYGLVIDTISCTYHTKPEEYRTYDLDLSCNKTSFTLSIANISQANNGDIWKCDVTIFGNQPPSKASTTVKVIAAVETDFNRGVIGGSHIVVTVIVGVSCALLQCLYI